MASNFDGKKRGHTEVPPKTVFEINELLRIGKQLRFDS